MSTPSVLRRLAATGSQLALERQAIKVCKEAGMIGGQSPLEIVATVRTVRRLGTTTAGVVNSAAKHGSRVAFVDERGSTTFADLDRRTNAIAHEWRRRGLRAGDGVAILCRNHTGLAEAFFAAGKLGARIVMLNTDFAGPQLRDAMAREGVELLVVDEEFLDRLEGLEPRCGIFRAWTDRPGSDTLDALAEAGRATLPAQPEKHAKIVVLTSGTTGTPKGAPRSEPRSLVSVGAILERVPFKANGTVELCAPMFHSLGLGYMMLLMALGTTMVLRRRFDPERTLASIAEHHSDGMIVVPIMLQRMVDLGEDAFEIYDVSSMRTIMVAGSQLGSELAQRGLAAFGPSIHNLYGSTEVAYATIATPEDLAVEPSCVGRPCLGAVVRILDERGAELPTGATGRIFVRNAIGFDGYTGGGHKEIIDGLMSTGDVGHFDDAGRLFIDGRDDEMIVSGGENVFPREVEELLEQDAGVNEVAVIGVDDAAYGHRLRAFVVRDDGATLTEDDLRDHVKANLARYKVPREVVFLERLPRNATGKVLKRELRLID
ncbi:acyl-CoA synthetase [Nocardioides sp.]|uniref:acyl-CoA synthetase n=1 Tax=Nocardioides sp. TaxID=35761 RepID=UPI00273672AB|nr:acyl-CoA synthetase [Nocardioides sp.]MDP3891756.1 acyl-CoA synthetase [Nocardioides sp.]